MLGCSEELGRAENKDMKSFVDKLAGVKTIIDDKGKIAGEPCFLQLQPVIGFYAYLSTVPVASALPVDLF